MLGLPEVMFILIMNVFRFFTDRRDGHRYPRCLPVAVRRCPSLPVTTRRCRSLPVAARRCLWLPVAARTTTDNNVNEQRRTGSDRQGRCTSVILFTVTRRIPSTVVADRRRLSTYHRYSRFLSVANIYRNTYYIYRNIYNL